MLSGLERTVERILADVCSEKERLSALHQVFERNVALPVDVHVIGQPVSLLELKNEVKERAGLTARCRLEDGSEHLVSAWELTFRAGSAGAILVAGYRKWLGLEPSLGSASGASGQSRQHKVDDDDIDLTVPVELLVRSVKGSNVRCSPLGSERIITLRARIGFEVVPAAIVTVQPRKQWRHAGHPYLSGEIVSCRLDVGRLGLAPLRLEERGIWDPGEDDWPKVGDLATDWARSIMARGARPTFEMEHVLPGCESEDFADLDDVVSRQAALMKMCDSDLRCLEAHADLGAMVFNLTPMDAIGYYEAGMRIGELSLPAGFDGLLQWIGLGNRPFLRCMHGYGLCLWRLGRIDEAAAIFYRLLWINPSDEQQARFLLRDVRMGKDWEDRRSET